MKALVKYAAGPGNVEIRDVQEPQCGDNQVKLEVGWCGICGTDLHVLHGTFRNFPPVILGHEMSATIIEVGKNVKRLEIGDWYCILGASAVTCGHCIYCRSGEFMFCPERRGMGHGVNGAFARYVVVRPDQLFRLPQGISREEGALCEPFAVAVHAVCEQTPLRVGDVALISGPGPIGLLCLKLLVAAGIKTIVAGTDADLARLQLASQIGADSTINVNQQDLMQHVQENTDGFGVDVAFECSGTGASVRNCLNVVRPRGHYTQVGHFGKEVMVPFDHVAFKQIYVTGSLAYTVETWMRMLKILEQGRIRFADLITHKLSLDEWQTGFAACESKTALKILLHP
ncbi:MAG: alcohol dehydrogenase catalytic domain-containing protein [Acidobacteriaceae bacterium]